MSVIQLVPESDARADGWISRLYGLDKGYQVIPEQNSKVACTYMITVNTVSLRVKQGINRAMKTDLFDLTPCEREIIRDMQAVGILI